jgi:cytochrome c-type biogenesis protein CcmF
MLYFGYVGFSVAFGFAIAALLSGNLEQPWARWSRPWTTVAWAFLTAGIALGSWWAYYELGWGGWWFWDPVENASFMPWLVGTALIHSLAVTDKRKVATNWTILLAIFAFSLSLLGTFLVRSGVITSVHAFATDPTRGVFILLFLAIVVGGSLALYAWRAPGTTDTGRFTLLSRETVLLANSVLFLVAAGSVLLGTLYPLIVDALGAGKLSVGPPYFNAVFVPLMIPVALFVGVGPLVLWRRQAWQPLLLRIAPALAASLALGALAAVTISGKSSLQIGLGLALALWVALSMVLDLRFQTRNRGNVWSGLGSLRRGYYGMLLAHFGVAVFVIGVTLTTNLSIEKDLRMAPGEASDVADHSFVLQGTSDQQGPNYVARTATVVVSRNGEKVVVLKPEKRIYRVQRNTMTEAAIDATLTRDIYVAMGEPLADGAWSMRVYYKPFVRWLWLGGIFMIVGGVLAATDRRYRSIQRAEEHERECRDPLTTVRASAS